MPTPSDCLADISRDESARWRRLTGLDEKPPVFEWKPRYRWYALAVDFVALIAVVVFVVRLCL